MRCSQQCYSAQRRRRLGAAKGLPTGSSTTPNVLSGTWDFKWPIGTKLRLAFQRLPRDVAGFDFAFEEARALVLDKFEQWVGGKAGVERPNITFAVVTDMPAPPLHPLGSPRNAKSDTRFTGFIEYDVLVSFLPLPLLLPATEQHAEEVLSTSVSELGRYAQRIEYGVPTVYLGPQPGLTASQWFGSAEGLFTVVHELGHVLGMPHEQQNPLLSELPWRPVAEMLEILEKRDGGVGDENLGEVLRSEITDPWPGEVRFSDWRSPPPNLQNGLESVMARPLYRCLLHGGHADGLDCRGLTQCPHEQQGFKELQSPTPGDLKHLLAMYGTAVHRVHP